MTRNARHLELLIMSTLILVSVILLYEIYWSINWRVEYMENFSLNEYEISWLKITLNYHLSFVVNAMLLVGSTLLLFNKKTGWYLIAIASLYYVIAWGIILMLSTIDDNGYTWIGFIFIIFFLVILTFLLSKPIRIKYALRKKSTYPVLIAVAVLLMDRFIF